MTIVCSRCDGNHMRSECPALAATPAEVDGEALANRIENGPDALYWWSGPGIGLSELTDVEFNSILTALRAQPASPLRGRQTEQELQAEIEACLAPDNMSAWNIRKYIDFLRADEGDSVTLFCDNPDFDLGANNAIECNGYWTDWKDRRFEGNTLEAALELAYFECRQWRENPPPEVDRTYSGRDVLKHCDELHDLGFNAGWNGAIEECSRVADQVALRCVREQIPGDATARFVAQNIRALSVAPPEQPSPLRGREALRLAREYISQDHGGFKEGDGYFEQTGEILRMIDAALSASPPEQPATKLTDNDLADLMKLAGDDRVSCEALGIRLRALWTSNR